MTCTSTCWDELHSNEVSCLECHEFVHDAANASDHETLDVFGVDEQTEPRDVRSATHTTKLLHIRRNLGRAGVR